jgi:L-ascorbate metabolism protein UlaG (beta-lactamase superfamily)
MIATMFRTALRAAALVALTFAPGAAFSACQLGMVERAPLDRTTGLLPVAAPVGTVKISYLGHSSFLIETPQGATAVTDYNGLNVPAAVPDIVSMNNPHTTHFTHDPNPAIKYVLRGWSPAGGLPAHDVKYKDLRVFNVPTNLGESYDAGFNSSSIFVFEISNLCIAHLGHLHHVLTRDQLLKLGRIDVLFVPIDGSSTMSHEDAMAVIKQVEPRLVIPMHFGFFGSADAFFERAKTVYTIKAEQGSVLVVDRRSLPRATEIRFLQAESQF